MPDSAVTGDYFPYLLLLSLSRKICFDSGELAPYKCQNGYPGEFAMAKFKEDTVGGVNLLKIL